MRDGDTAGRWLKIGEVSQKLGVSEGTVRNYVDDHRLDDPVPARVMPSGYRLVHETSVAKFIAGLSPRRDSDT